MLSQLIRVNGINDGAIEPARLTRPLSQLFSELSQRVPVSLRGFRSHFQRAFGIGVVRGQQNAALCFDGKHTVTRFQMQPVGHIFWQRRTYRTAGLAQRDFLRHMRQSSTDMLLTRRDPARAHE